ncbi:nucleotidyltransferase domain-containing protein [Agrococcus jejuensis]|uniref:Nucleotidyltransferase domain-containing protein n=1 Tax=Agrococcus jejuensis TaxID=399736 RepID=A0A1G8B5C2_9MICO|nr:nucleotidyltransferase domain-containing protein [Agrococcus jejuensis]SDH28345.1 Nucleotidyltransferase domain-containing protein [Agrococcus jejuensis]
MLSEHMDRVVQAMARDLVAVDGVVAVVMGGSRARNAHAPSSDVDLGLYTRGAVDFDALDELAARWSSTSTRFARPGEWGPWVDCGAWLEVDGMPVDWIRRDLDRVEQQWTRAQRGEHAFHAQAGHPLGFLDVAYVGELVHARILQDPTDALQLLRERMERMPDALGDALVAGLWEADLLLTQAGKAAARGDDAFVLLCLSRTVLLACHALAGRDRRWVVNEKRLVAEAQTMPHAPDGLERRVRNALSTVDGGAAALERCVEATRELVADVRVAIA